VSKADKAAVRAISLVSTRSSVDFLSTGKDVEEVALNSVPANPGDHS
jgi:hypothetical protein